MYKETELDKETCAISMQQRTLEILESLPLPPKLLVLIAYPHSMQVGAYLKVGNAGQGLGHLVPSTSREHQLEGTTLLVYMIYSLRKSIFYSYSP